MNGIIGEFRIGEDITVALDATSGNAATVSAISAAMKPGMVSANRLAIDPAVAGTAMTVSPQSPASAGWLLAIHYSQSALLEPGVYGIDARLMIGGAVEITDQTAFIRLSRATVA